MGLRSPTCLVQSETKGPTDVTRALATFIGIGGLSGDLGVILPMATSFAPWLTARTAVGLATIMLLAIGFHVRRHASRAASKLAEANIKINFAYCGVEPSTNSPLVIFGTAEVGRAATILDQTAAVAARA